MTNLKIEYVDIKALKPADYNPRKWSDSILEQIKKSIEKFGIVDPLIVNRAENRKNVVVGGHLRLKACKDMGFKEVPVVYVDIADIEKEKELNIRLNKNMGEWDELKLFTNYNIDLLKDIGFEYLIESKMQEIDKGMSVDLDINRERDFILIVFNNKTDFINFCEKQNMGEVLHPKNRKVGQCRAIEFEKLIK